MTPYLFQSSQIPFSLLASMHFHVQAPIANLPVKQLYYQQTAASLLFLDWQTDAGPEV